MTFVEEKHLMISLDFLKVVLSATGMIGLLFGLLSFLQPKAPLRLYQWTMSLIHWRVEPENEAVELRNTRIMGALMIPMSLIIFLFLKRW